MKRGISRYFPRYGVEKFKEAESIKEEEKNDFICEITTSSFDLLMMLRIVVTIEPDLLFLSFASSSLWKRAAPFFSSSRPRPSFLSSSEQSSVSVCFVYSELSEGRMQRQRARFRRFAVRSQEPRWSRSGACESSDD